ncbi:hypothetical protein LSTR_LSTR006201 [Laodelphax striatellus]|uniref:Uncharacterized protein n=1 Tax=Laodelphax striatellus TaxID=195883 RepID=A0A482XRC9_LAOST|nr:hypothetical protein LSTR_LSTR006201 [Laodelphax striatellus]
MKLILLLFLTLLCLSHQKGDIKGAEDVKKFIDKCGWFKQKDPIIIKVNEKNIINIEKEAPGSLPVTANGGQESISSSSSPVSPIENAITLEEIVDQLKDLGTGIIQPISTSNDIVKGVNNGVEEALDSVARAGQAPISAVSNSADEILQQPQMLNEKSIQKSSAIVTGTDTTGEQNPTPETVISVATLPLTAILDPLKQHTLSDGSAAKPNPNELSPITIQSQLASPIQQANPITVAVDTVQLQSPVLATIPMDGKPKLEIYTGPNVNQIQQATNQKQNNHQQSIKFPVPQSQIPQFQNTGFIFGGIFNLIPNLIPQIQQAIPQFVPPVIYPILPKVLTPILPPVVSNIIFPSIPNPQEKNN